MIFRRINYCAIIISYFVAMISLNIFNNDLLFRISATVCIILAIFNITQYRININFNNKDTNIKRKMYMKKYEKCKNCIYCKKLYVPPCDCYNEIPKDAYVCTLFLENEKVMYMGTNKLMCEMFTRKMKKEKINNENN